jgi:hypothetical protein
MVLGLVTVLCAAPAMAKDDEVLHFGEHGFSIKPLKGKVTDVPTQVLFMAMSPQAGFAPNVNVQLQPYEGSIDQYFALSKSQFGPMGIKVLWDKKTGPDSISFEYAGAMQGHELHWYARAVRPKNRAVVYLITATASAEQWASVATALKDNVDSFKLE